MDVLARFSKSSSRRLMFLCLQLCCQFRRLDGSWQPTELANFDQILLSPRGQVQDASGGMLNKWWGRVYSHCGYATNKICSKATLKLAVLGIIHHLNGCCTIRILCFESCWHFFISIHFYEYPFCAFPLHQKAWSFSSAKAPNYDNGISDSVRGHAVTRKPFLGGKAICLV